MNGLPKAVIFLFVLATLLPSFSHQFRIKRQGSRKSSSFIDLSSGLTCCSGG
uniref:Uncharacterized protein n=1 Tax=Romanomermis culicivorax TaxID=13658 RepID=A0A915IKY3_ROMCU